MPYNVSPGDLVHGESDNSINRCGWVFQCIYDTTTDREFTCGKNPEIVGGACPEVNDHLTPETHEHNINTDYTMNFNGRIIPLVKTTRKYKHQFSRVYSMPTDIKRYSSYYLGCNWTDPEWKTSISEDCVIEKSTLHHLDQTNKVLLYRYVKEQVKFAKSVEVKGFDENVIRQGTARFRAGGQIGSVEYFNKVMVPITKSIATGVEEWRLIIGDTEKVISKVEYDINVMPWGGPQSYLDVVTGQYVDKCEDPNGPALSIFVFPPPSSRDMPLDLDIFCNGFYDYGSDPSTLDEQDGGFKDMFYPQWCRALHLDPFWQAAINPRISMGGIDDSFTESDSKYVPPPPTVDPIPRGSFVKHPVLKEMYQFLTTSRNGENTITTYPDINKLIEQNLGKGLALGENTLYYPISLY